MAIAAIVKCLYNFPFCVFVSEYMNKKRLSNFIKPFERMWITFILEIGGDEGNRTPDLLVANETLSRTELRPHITITFISSSYQLERLCCSEFLENNKI